MALIIVFKEYKIVLTNFLSYSFLLVFTTYVNIIDGYSIIIAQYMSKVYHEHYKYQYLLVAHLEGLRSN